MGGIYLGLRQLVVTVLDQILNLPYEIGKVCTGHVDEAPGALGVHRQALNLRLLFA